MVTTQPRPKLIASAFEKPISTRHAHDSVDEDQGEPQTNDGWIIIDLAIECRAVRIKGQTLIQSAQGFTDREKNDYAKYGVVIACGSFRGREKREDQLTDALEKQWPLPYGTLIESICMVPYRSGASQGMIRTEHVTRWWVPGKSWPSWVIPNSSKSEWYHLLKLPCEEAKGRHE